MPGGGGASLEVDHKRGVVVVRGLPEEVEEGRKEFQDKLASLFPGDFLAVSCHFNNVGLVISCRVRHPR